MGKGREREIIDVGRAGELLGVSVFTVHRWCQKGDIESYKLGKGISSPRRIYLDSVIAFAKEVQGRDLSVER